MAGMALARMGRFADAERHLGRAEEALRGGADPGTEVLLHHARGMVRFGEGRFQEALGELARAQRLEGLLAGRHVLMVDVHGRALQVRVRMGDTGPVRETLAGSSPEQRDRAGMRLALGALELAEGDPERAVEALAPVISGTAPAMHERWARVEALLLDATARDHLGDGRAAEASLESALELAEPEGLVLPFLLWPSRELLERHPGHRTAHAALISTIRDVLAGRAAPRR